MLGAAPVKLVNSLKLSLFNVDRGERRRERVAINLFAFFVLLGLSPFSEAATAQNYLFNSVNQSLPVKKRLFSPSSTCKPRAGAQTQKLG